MKKLTKAILNLLLVPMAACTSNIYTTRQAQITHEEVINIKDEKIIRYYIPKTQVKIDITPCTTQGKSDQSKGTQTNTSNSQSQSDQSKSPTNPPSAGATGIVITNNYSPSSGTAPTSSADQTKTGSTSDCQQGISLAFSTEDRNDENLAFDLYYASEGIHDLFEQKNIDIKVNNNQQFTSSDSKVTPQITQVLDSLGQTAGAAVKLSAQLSTVAISGQRIKEITNPAQMEQLQFKKPDIEATLRTFNTEWLNSDYIHDSCALDPQNDAFNQLIQLIKVSKDPFITSDPLYANIQILNPPQIDMHNYINVIDGFINDLKNGSSKKQQEPKQDTTLNNSNNQIDALHLSFNPCNNEEKQKANASIQKWIRQMPGLTMSLFVNDGKELIGELCHVKTIDGANTATVDQTYNDWSEIDQLVLKNKKGVNDAKGIPGLIAYDKRPLAVTLERRKNFCKIPVANTLFDPNTFIAFHAAYNTKANVKDIEYTAYVPVNTVHLNPEHNIVANSQTTYSFNNGLLTEYKSQQDSYAKGTSDIVLAIPKAILSAVGGSVTGSTSGASISSGQSSGTQSNSQGNSNSNNNSQNSNSPQNSDSSTNNNGSPTSTQNNNATSQPATPNNISEWLCSIPTNSVSPACKNNEIFTTQEPIVIDKVNKTGEFTVAINNLRVDYAKITLGNLPAGTVISANYDTTQPINVEDQIATIFSDAALTFYLTNFTPNQEVTATVEAFDKGKIIYNKTLKFPISQ